MPATRMRLGIPLKLLLLVSCLLALLPWVGLSYVRELERLLRRAQEQGLVATARAVATALHDRPNVLRSGEVYSMPGESGPDLWIPNLSKPIVVDGRTEDWAQAGVPEHERGGWAAAGTAPFSFRYRLGRYGGAVYALFEVQDDVVLREGQSPGGPDRAESGSSPQSGLPVTATGPLQSETAGTTDVAGADQIRIALVTPNDEELRFEVDAVEDGPVRVFRTRPGSPRQQDDRIEGFWRSVPGGYVVELRLPRQLIGPRLAFGVDDVDDPATRTLAGRLSTSAMGTREELGTVQVPSPEASELIRGLGRARSRIWVVDTEGRVLAQAGTLRPPAAEDDGSGGGWDWLARRLRPLTRRLLSEPHEDFRDREPGTYRLDEPELRAALAGREETRTRTTPDGRAVVASAAHPVFVDERVAGAVLVEETTNDVIAGRNRGFERLFAATLAVGLLGAATLVVFAARLSARIRGLRDDVERAIDPQGRISGTVRGTRAGDELGDLARSFAGILESQRQYTAYLEQVGKRLSHELRTPVGVVRSSLDNLSLERLPEEARVYIERAEEGLRRLSTILSRISEASRLEQGLAATEREPFEIGPVVRGTVEGYRAAHPERTIELRLPDEALRRPEQPLRVLGSPDLLAQLLDKLVENALSFARPGTPVVVSVVRHGRALALSVANDGPRLPAEMEGRLFESMVSVRPAAARAGGEPHLGLGLYIVRLIAQFHGGSAAAHDRPDGEGVIVTVSLPLLSDDGAAA